MMDTITNSHRAARAGNALATFDQQTHDTTIRRLGKEDLADAVADLICDLLHLANHSSIDRKESSPGPSSTTKPNCWRNRVPLRFRTQRLQHFTQ
jgi:hypothetical protein